MKKLVLLIIVLLMTTSLFARQYNSIFKKVILNQNGYYTIKWVDDSNCSSYTVVLEQMNYIKGKFSSGGVVLEKDVTETKIDIPQDDLTAGGEYYITVYGNKDKKNIIYEKDILLDSIVTLTLPKFSIYTKDGQTKTYNTDVEITPAMFFFESSQYNKYLALASATASSAAYFCDEKKINENLANYFTKIGFQDAVFYNDESIVTTKANSDKVFFGIARRKINIKQKTFDVVAVVVRGTVAGEWFSNVNIGEGIYHEGFKLSADEVAAKIDEYVKKYKLTNKENTKIWITGHSRGGSVTNILSYEMLKKSYVKPENLYTYTFASTEVITKPLGNTNCVNFVNKGDFVPTIPFWDGWTKFGYEINNLSLSDEQQKEINEEFKDITGVYYEGYSEEEMNLMLGELKKIAPTLNDYYTKKFNTSAKDGGRTAYDVCNIISNMAASGKPKDLNKIPNEFNKFIGTLLRTNMGTPKVMNAHSPEYYILFVTEYNKGIRDFNAELDLYKK